MTRKPSVTLRRREAARGRVKLYLDIYSKGVRRYESLGLFLIPETCAHDKAVNRETLREAESVRALRLTEVESVTVPSKVTVGVLADRRTSSSSQSTAEIYRSAFIRIYDVLPHDTQVACVTKEDCERVRAHLSRCGVRANTAAQYWSKFRAVLNDAVREGYIMRNPADVVRPPRQIQTHRQYLTMDEVSKIASVRWRDDGHRRAFLFSCLTGMRYSDIRKLEWSEVSDDGRRITFRQKKTGGMEYLDINAQAYRLMGERGTGRVFRTLRPYMSVIETDIDTACRLAGIDKHITFHCARHTFATMMLTLGTDIYTVSKLLGHTDISTTQIYAKIVDQKKTEAVDMIPSLV